MVGINTGGPTTSSYWNDELSGLSVSAGGTKIDDQSNLRVQATFIGWDYGSIWSINEGVTTPYLQGLAVPFASEHNYATWADNIIWSGGDSSETADPDGDGVQNTMEYALNLDPVDTNDAGNMPTAVISGSMLDFTFYRTRDNAYATYTVQSSPNLITWTDIDVNPGIVGALVTVSRSVPVFMRLKVTTP